MAEYKDVVVVVELRVDTYSIDNTLADDKHTGSQKRYLSGMIRADCDTGFNYGSHFV